MFLIYLDVLLMVYIYHVLKYYLSVKRLFAIHSVYFILHENDKAIILRSSMILYSVFI